MRCKILRTALFFGIIRSKERCPSGLRCGPRKSVKGNTFRGFESHPLRIKRSGDSRPFYFAGEDENPADAKHLCGSADAKHLCGFERGVSRVRRSFAKRMKFFEAKTVDTFYANDSRQSHPLRIKRSVDSRPVYFGGEDENPADAKHLCGFERGVSRVYLFE